MAGGLRGKCAIVGVGHSPIGKVPGVGAPSLFAMAAKAALEDAGLKKTDIDGMVVRGPEDIGNFHQRVGQLLGLDARFSTGAENGGAGQILSLSIACMAIDAGLCSTALVGFGVDAWSRTHRSEENRMMVARGDAAPRRRAFGPEFGLFGAPAGYALAARRHMDLFGTTKAQLGAIALAFREHATRNPHAFLRDPITMEDYLSAREIVAPLSLYDCSIFADAAGAMIVTSAERAKDLAKVPAYVLGFGFGNNLRGWYHGEHMVNTGGIQAAEAAYGMAGIGPEDVDTAQFYDCFTHMVLLQLEDYGFCQKGEGGPFAASGALTLRGALPSNTSGGQLSEGHCEGVLQIVEGVRQVRHDYGPERQVDDVEVALVTGHGGIGVCESALVLGRSPS